MIADYNAVITYSINRADEAARSVRNVIQFLDNGLMAQYDGLFHDYPSPLAGQIAVMISQIRRHLEASEVMLAQAEQTLQESIITV